MATRRGFVTGLLAAGLMPRGGVAQVFAVQDGAFMQEIAEAEACGLSAHQSGLMITNGTGRVSLWHNGQITRAFNGPAQFDKHLVAIASL